VASNFIDDAYVEAKSHKNGVGLLRIMGKQSGFIAMGASIASRSVNICLIPEFSFDLYGK